MSRKPVLLLHVKAFADPFPTDSDNIALYSTPSEKFPCLVDVYQMTLICKFICVDAGVQMAGWHVIFRFGTESFTERQGGREGWCSIVLRLPGRVEFLFKSGWKRFGNIPKDEVLQMTQWHHLGPDRLNDMLWRCGLV